MDNLPIMHARLKYFDGRVEIFNKWNKYFEDGVLDKKDCWNFLRVIEGVVSYYWRYIRRYYKIFKSEILTMPVEGYKRAKADGLIKDADVWLEYVEDVNRLLNIEDKELKEKTLRQFLEIYRKKVPLMFECMHSPENLEIIRSSEPAVREYMSKELVLADNKPIYHCSEIGITEISYNYLLNYFKSEPCIHNVWLHGSRLHGKNTYSSDIDLIIDCPEAEMSRIKTGADELPIPYFCDFSNVYRESDQFLLRIAMCAGTKKIYCADDFDMHWNKADSKKSLTVNISSIVMGNVN